MKNPSNLFFRPSVPSLAAAGLLALAGCGDDASASGDTDPGAPTSSTTAPMMSGSTGTGNDSGSTTEPSTGGTIGSTGTTGASDVTGTDTDETEGSTDETGETGGEVPALFVDFPLGRSTSVEDVVTVRGHVTDFDAAEVLVRVADTDVTLGPDGTFTVEVPLSEGANTVTAELIDAGADVQLDVIEREVVRQLLFVDPLAIASGPDHDVVYLADGTHGIVAVHKETGTREVLATPDTTSTLALAFDHLGNRLVVVDRILDTLQLIDPEDGSITTLLDEIPGFQISWARMDADRNRVFLGYGSQTAPIVVDLDTGASQTFAPDAPWSQHLVVGIDPVGNRTFARGYEDWLLIDLDSQSHQLVPTEPWLGAYTAGFVDPSGAAGYRVRTSGSPVVRRVEFDTWEESGAGSFPSSYELVGPTADERGLLTAMIGNSPFASEVDIMRAPWDGSGVEIVASNRFPEALTDDCSGGETEAAGSTLFSLCFFGYLRAIDLESGGVSIIEPPDWGSRIAELEFDAERGALLALFSDPGGSAEFEGVARYSLRDGTWEQHIATSNARSGHFDFDPVSDTIVVSSSYPNSTAVLFDAESGGLTQVLNLIDNGVSTIAIDEDAIYYLASATSFVNRYDRDSGTLSQLITAEETPAGGTPFSLTVDAQGDRLLASTGAGRIIAIDRTTGAATTLVQGGLLEPHESNNLLDTGAYLGDYAWMPQTQTFAVQHRGRIVLHDLLSGDAVTLTR